LRKTILQQGSGCPEQYRSVALELHCTAAAATPLHLKPQGSPPLARRSAAREQQPPQRSASNSTAAQRQRKTTQEQSKTNA